jgi:chromosome segregation ATPase
VPTKLKALPFDDRNNSDFEEMTVRIRQGLESIRKNKALNATQTTLARLAQCSRKTLSLRRWPIDELKRIKDERNTKHKNAEEEIPKESGNEENRERQLIKQVRNYQDQNGRLFDQVQHLQEQKSKADSIIGTLEQQVTGLTEEVRQLEKDLRMTKLGVVEGLGICQTAQV